VNRMASYIGNKPVAGEFKRLDSIASQFNGVLTSFTLNFNSVSVSAGDASQLIVSLDGVVQEPLGAYTLGVGGSTIVFGTAPVAGSTCHIVQLGGVGGTITGTLTDNIVTTAKIGAGAVTSDRITIDGDISFPDGIQAKFGTGNDLRIYSSGSHSFITHGTSSDGDLKILGENVEIGNSSAVANFKAVSGAQTILYHNGNTKLETTSTGINVTGTVAANGLSINGGGVTVATSGTNTLTSNGTLRFDIDHDNDATDNRYHFTKNAGAGTVLEAREDGDVKFYNAAGTDVEFLWDASAESLNIGDTGSSTDRRLNISSTGPQTATTQYGVVVNPTMSNDVTGSIYNIYSQANVASGATLTNLYGVYVGAAGLNSSTVANVYGIYQAGTSDKNYFAGKIGIGGTNAISTNPQWDLVVGSNNSVGTNGQIFVDATVNGTGDGITIDGDGRSTGDGSLFLIIDKDNTVAMDVGTDGITDIKQIKQVNLTPINTSNSVTAIDLFIYDTSKDSDGGAWRKRTQNTSWYNETLNTSIRGSRKEFPAVAVIVTRNTEVTIYDGDDPTLPMWMVFDGTGYSMLSNTHNGITRAAMKNGNLAVTSVSGYNHGGLAVINFISDYAYLKTAGYTKENTQGIANRGTQHQANDGTSNYIANNFVRSVAITVLPTAPIDSATGLPVPTIAIATDGGISVVKDNGDVFAITNTGSGYNYWDTVKFTKDYKLIIQANNQNISNQLTHIVDIPTSNVNANNVNARYGALNGRYYHGDSCSPRLSASSFKPKVAALEKDMICMGHTQTLNGGLNFISEEPSTQSGQTSNSMMAYVDVTKNTGWFVGDAKIVALASTDDTDISSSGNVNILAGKNWTNNASFPYETLTTSGLDISSAINTTAYGAANLTWVSTPGKTYTTYFNMTLNSGTMPRCFMQTSSSFGNGLEFTPENGANSFTFKATRSGSIYFSFSTNNGDASNYAVSGLELYEGGDANHYENPLVVNDHIGLSVIGTVTKTAVETGADLMAYSGFNATNYLYQPYNSAINFGTGDCSYTWWGTAFSSGTDRVWFSHGKYNTASSGLNVLQYNSGGSGDEAHFYLGNSAAGDVIVTGVEHGRWDCWTVTRKTGVMYVYRNGKLEGSVANVNNVNTSSLSHKGLYLGVGVSGSSVFPYGARELALFRISRTATTSEQAEKIYNDERHLFQENAKATLYGTDVIITSLAHDDDTGLLHVGTAAGRSVFQGLSRIDNTTDAVGAAISASNGLVVEE